MKNSNSLSTRSCHCLLALLTLMAPLNNSFAALSIGEHADKFTKRIYQTIPREKGEVMFKQATAYLTDTVIGEILERKRQQFVDKFSISYVDHYIAQATAPMLRPLFIHHQDDLRHLVEKEALIILLAHEKTQKERLKQTLSPCASSIQADVAVLFVSGKSDTFTASTTLPNTTKCIEEKSRLEELFSNEMNLHKHAFAEKMLAHMLAVVSAKPEKTQTQ